ncbi:MAG TPA: HD domain-containing protein [Clostridiales bacterium]|nr:HD domain-containing protein [Clostridiales bacterium]
MSADSIPEIPSSIDKVQEEFIKIFNKEIKRPGMDKLVDYLVNKSDFFIAPASTRFHLSEEGGLARHSLNVYYRLKMLVANEKFDIRTHISQENIAICGLLHDVCKANYYIKDLRNVKKGGQWTKEPFYKVDEKFPYGHGEKSVFIISQYMNITANEAMAINWHMGPYDDRVARSFGRLGDVFEKFPLALLTHIADLEATYMDEV